MNTTLRYFKRFSGPPWPPLPVRRTEQQHGPWCRPETCEVERSWYPHWEHGLLPWRTCSLCWHMSWAVFVRWPLEERLHALRWHLGRVLR